jgi:hypothetical protein
MLRPRIERVQPDGTPGSQSHRSHAPGRGQVAVLPFGIDHPGPSAEDRLAPEERLDEGALTPADLPDIATHRVVGSPFGAVGKEEWSLAAIGIASVATALLEPDPDLKWDTARLAKSQEALRSWIAHPAGDS